MSHLCEASHLYEDPPIVIRRILIKYGWPDAPSLSFRYCDKNATIYPGTFSPLAELIFLTKIPSTENGEQTYRPEYLDCHQATLPTGLPNRAG